MTSHHGSIARSVTVVTIAVGSFGIAPRIAEAQSRGTMQVSANVVSTESSFSALEAARTAVSRGNTQAAIRRQKTAPTVAQVSVKRDPRRVIVTIDYSRS